jgi:hypothetical protein
MRIIFVLRKWWSRKSKELKLQENVAHDDATIVVLNIVAPKPGTHEMNSPQNCSLNVDAQTFLKYIACFLSTQDNINMNYWL